MISRDIPARNRRQAMDWSLVLASQGIEHRIEHDENTDANGWSLTVSETDHASALAHIQQYRLENLHWRWRRSVIQPGLFFDWSCLAWVALVISFFAWSENRADLRTLGRMDGFALMHGEWWRLFTATWLHADLAHLAGNVVFGFLFLGLVMGRYGPGIGILAAYFAGVGGNIITWLVYGETQRGLGASGVVMGALGLFTVQSFAILKQRNANALRLFAGAILAGLLLFIFLGTSPGTDVVAHLGGFISGLLLGALLVFMPQSAHRSGINLAAAIFFAVLIVTPWWCAFTRPG